MVQVTFACHVHANLHGPGPSLVFSDCIASKGCEKGESKGQQKWMKNANYKRNLNEKSEK